MRQVDYGLIPLLLICSSDIGFISEIILGGQPEPGFLICIPTYVHTYVYNAYTYVCTYIRMCKYVRIYGQVYIRMYIRMYVCTYVSLLISNVFIVWTCVRKCQLYVCTYVHTVYVCM